MPGMGRPESGKVVLPLPVAWLIEIMDIAALKDAFGLHLIDRMSSLQEAIRGTAFWVAGIVFMYIAGVACTRNFLFFRSPGYAHTHVDQGRPSCNCVHKVT